MSSRRSTASDARKLEDMDSDDEDIEMGDAVDAAGSDMDAEGEFDEEVNQEGSQDMFETISDLSTYLCSAEEDGEELASGFQRIPNRRVLPDYFEVIAEPVAFSTIRGKIQRKLYSSFSEFVRDVAQICHNAQVYNRPSAPIFGAAERLREVFVEKLQELVASGKINADEAKLPDLGELPPVEDSPVPGSTAEDHDEDDEEEDDEEEEDEDEDEDEEYDSDEDAGRRRRRLSRGRPSSRRDRDGERDGERDEDTHKKRGRPPMVLTPMEARISSILRGLRKFKDGRGTLLILPFEKLPDKAQVTDYYQTISAPIALDNIKKKAKRKKYHSVEQVMVDIERMFENAKTYNEDDSPVHKAAVELQTQARVLAEQEKAKPDDDFRDEDGKLPLAGIDYQGEIWRVGDWVHIRNPNDLAKPIVAQVYRTWQDRDGQRWINACWYYRPEQTVHRYDKHFFDHEVVKTGQYRDHQIEDVVDRCFVMFVTRFGRGRPRGFPRDKAVYVCESRYNEEKFRFNKIKTWASCVPDEVRERDYEMDLFDGPPQRLRKTPSPIKHLLREDAKETDDLPKPTWGSPNAPPIVGAVHKRPRESNESPPPEPTPPPQPTSSIVDASVDSARRPSMLGTPGEMARDVSMRGISNAFPGPAGSPSQGQFQAHLTPHYQPATPVPMHQTPVPIPQPPQQNSSASQTPMRQMQFQHTPYPQSGTPHYSQPLPPMHHQAVNSMGPGYMQGPSQTPRPSMGPTQGTPGVHGNMYNPPRPPEVYTLSDVVNDAIPSALREQFQRDEAGRILFFTAPPLDRAHSGLSAETAGLGHSAKYLAGRQKWLEERESKRKLRDQAVADDPEAARKRIAKDNASKETDASISSQATHAVEKWFDTFDQDSQRWRKEVGLEGWRDPIQS